MTTAEFYRRTRFRPNGAAHPMDLRPHYESLDKVDRGPEDGYAIFKSLDFDEQCRLMDALAYDGNHHNGLIARMRADGTWLDWESRYDARVKAQLAAEPVTP